MLGISAASPKRSTMLALNIFHSRHFNLFSVIYCRHSSPQSNTYSVQYIVAIMSRSAVDATRFTATSPHAYSKPSALRTAASNTFSPSSIPRSHTQPKNVPPFQLPPQGSGSPNETPAQKVARLRAQHASQKQGQISTWDRIVLRGRVWADRAHRATALGLISLTGQSQSILGVVGGRGRHR